MPYEAGNSGGLKAGAFHWDACRSIIARLQQVRFVKGQPGKGIEPAEARALQEWVVSGVVDYLRRRFTQGEMTWPEYVEHKCTLANAAARDIAGDLPEAMVQNYNICNLGGVPHAGMVLKLPVSDINGKACWRYRLVDPTFAQFISDAPYDRLMATAEGKALAQELITTGGAELSEERARLYLEAFAPALELQKQRQAQPSYCEVLCHADEGRGRFVGGKRGSFVSR